MQRRISTLLSTEPHHLKLLEIAGASLRGLVRMTVLFVWFLLLLFQQLLGFIFRTGDGRHIRLRFYRGALRILGIKIKVYKEFSLRRPLLIAANHVSYLDIFVLGSLIPAVFVAKREVKQWPIIGIVAAIQKTIFISRKKTRVRDSLIPVVEALNRGSNVVVFPEGTSTDGKTIVPFKTAFFEASLSTNAYVQPVSLVYRERHGNRLSAKDRDFYTWGTDAPFLSHFGKLIVRPGLLVEVWIRPILPPTLERKTLAKLAQKRISAPLRHRAEKE